jgi:tRNA pseudouridine38-40 synthase
MRYFLHFAYQGYNFRGWQQQPGEVRTVQGVMEGIFQRILKHEVSLVGCGRTDAQVHASQYFAHFDTPEELRPDFKFILNKNLPATISIFDVIPVHPRAHARYDATDRQYDYLLHTRKQAFLGELSALYLQDAPDVNRMKAAATQLLQFEDFQAYCLTPDRHNTTICHLRQVRIFANPDRTRIRLQFAANRFLRGMIRILVYRLLEVGWGQITLEDFLQPLREQDPPRPLRSAYPEGLYLSRVTYPYIDKPPRVQLNFEE